MKERKNSLLREGRHEGIGMDGLVAFLDVVRRVTDTPDRFRGLLHILIGRRITLDDGTLISAGLTWRETASLFKRVRWDKDAVTELGLESQYLPPRDRERYWYTAIQHAQLDSDRTRHAGDALSKALASHGYRITAGPK